MSYAATMFDFDTYVVELLEALFSFDEEKIRFFFSANSIHFDDTDEEGFWRAVCEFLDDLNITYNDISAKAHDWLIQHGYRKGNGRMR